MKRIISLMLIISVLITVFTACTPPNDDDSPNDSTSNTSGSGHNESIVVPAYKDYGRDTQNFADIVYSSPDYTAVISAFDAVTDAVKQNTLPVGDQIGEIEKLEEGYESINSMYTLAEINSYKDSSNVYWQNEIKYHAAGFPQFTQAVEQLLVACAASVHKTEFEEKYFGYSLDEYVNGGIYTDEVVALLAEEAALEAEYSGLSSSDITIDYKSLDGFSVSGTLEEVVAQIAENYGLGSNQYLASVKAANILYNQKLLALQKPIYMELLKVRSRIGEALKSDQSTNDNTVAEDVLKSETSKKYSSYTDYAYEQLGYDYDQDQMNALLEDITAYVSPIATELYNSVFRPYFTSNAMSSTGITSIINTLHNVYYKMNKQTDAADSSLLYEIYCYMLQHGLYDIQEYELNRYTGAFTTYIDSNNSPFIFATLDGRISDYLTVAHEFGHFADEYINYGNSAPLHLAEISSQSLEFLTLTALKSELGTDDYEYLEYYSLYSSLNGVLLTQSFYAIYEHMVYELEEDEITEANIENLVRKAFAAVYGESAEMESDPFYQIMIPHIVLYPFYVESYVSSCIVSLDIYSQENSLTGESGKGMEKYLTLIDRNGKDMTFTEYLENAGLESPFDDSHVKEVTNNIYYMLVGKLPGQKEFDDLLGVA